MWAIMLGPVITSILVGIIGILLLCWYSSRHHQYWKKRNIPFAKPIPIFGSLFEIFTKLSHIVERERYEKYGTIYGSFEGSRPVLAVADPELLRKIFVKDFHVFPHRRIFVTCEPTLDLSVFAATGEDWKRIRSIITPTFTTGKLKKMISIFKECAQVCVNNFTLHAKLGKPVDLTKYFEAFTMDVIASSAFSTKVDSHNDPNNDFVTSARDLFKNFFSWRFLLFMLFPMVSKVLGIGAVPLKDLHFFKNRALEIIEERKRTGKMGNDFLQLLLDTSQETEDQSEIHESDDLTNNYSENEGNDQDLKTNHKNKLSNIEIVAQCVTFFFAGFDAVSATLSFVAYSLALNPEVQEKLIDELDEVLSFTDGKLTYEAIQSMKYLDNVIAETLRMYPPAERAERVANEDYEMKSKGIKISKGILIYMPITAIHYDPRYYPNPQIFDPDRFLPQERTKRDQFSYVPFGFGPRSCIGIRFALLKVKVCMAFLLSNFRLKKCDQTKVPLEYLSRQTVLKPKEIILQLELRKDCIHAA